MNDDESLILQFRNGSREAFEELFARYRDPLHGFFRRRIENASRAEELTQETFLAVLRASARYEPRSPVRTYLYGIALKLVMAERRKLGREIPSAAEPEVHEPAENALWVRQAISRLDPADREVLLLREYEQLSYAEIGDLLRLPVNTVRSRLFRSRMALKQQLDPSREEARNV